MNKDFRELLRKIIRENIADFLKEKEEALEENEENLDDVIKETDEEGALEENWFRRDTSAGRVGSSSGETSDKVYAGAPVHEPLDTKERGSRDKSGSLPMGDDVDVDSSAHERCMSSATYLARLKGKTPADPMWKEKYQSCMDNAEKMGLDESSDDDNTLEEDDNAIINTPEQEDTINEARFGARNTKLFKKLLKKWTN